MVFPLMNNAAEIKITLHGKHTNQIMAWKNLLNKK